MTNDELERAAGHNPDGPTCDIYIHDDPDAGKPWAGYRKDADAILSLIQSERGGA